MNSNSLFIIIDMLKGFVDEGPLADKKIDSVTPYIIHGIKGAKDNKAQLVFFRDEHEVDDLEFKEFPPHCIKNTTEAEIIDALKPFEKDFIMIPKQTTNGFVAEGFQKLISENIYDEVYVTGCCTDICVINFVTSFLEYIKENNLKTKVIVLEDAVATFDGVNHDGQKRHDDALKQMKQLGAILQKEGK